MRPTSTHICGEICLTASVTTEIFVDNGCCIIKRPLAAFVVSSNPSLQSMPLLGDGPGHESTWIRWSVPICREKIAEMLHSRSRKIDSWMAS